MTTASHRKQRLKRQEPSYQPSAIDRWVYVAIVIGPLFTLSQVYDIWVLGRREGVSVLSWGAYVVASIIWLLYGLKRKDRAIVTVEVIWIILGAAILVGVLWK